ncbi:MAG: UDP-N-acetylmuramate dehydrogenase [Sphingomonadales bacterium]
MMAFKIRDNLLDSLPNVEGHIEENASLAKYTWFRTGGPAEILFKPKNKSDLQNFMNGCPKNIPLTFVGVGSNMIIRDGGIEGVVIKLGKSFSNIKVEEEYIIAEAGAMDVTVSSEAQKLGLAGLEFLRGIPGTIGGTVKMNGGAYGSEVSDRLVSAKILSRDGIVKTILASEFGFSYRKTSLTKDDIILEATFKCEKSNSKNIQARMDEIMAARESTQPLRTRTGGSTFKNPDVKLSGGKKAWQLIDDSGCRGLTLGGAKVSEKHCNFLINTGKASSKNIEDLGLEVKRKVLDKTGVVLEWEISLVGQKCGSQK